jgi:hypothetical protein
MIGTKTMHLASVLSRYFGVAIHTLSHTKVVSRLHAGVLRLYCR